MHTELTFEDAHGLPRCGAFFGDARELFVHLCFKDDVLALAFFVGLLP